MFDVLSKPRDDITPGDIQALVDTKVPESEALEFKRELPADNGRTDSWMGGGSRINRHAKDVLLKESVAFANAYGGALVLGISEANSVAEAISLIPRCKDLAECLRHVFRDCVEPELPHLEIFGVETEGSSGVVLFRVPKSRLAPHRVRRTLICPIRRADRCEAMTMREIQDLTINLSRGLQRIDEELARRSRGLTKQLDRFHAPYGAYGLRFTAIPVTDDIGIERLLHDHELDPRFKPPSVAVMRRLPSQDTLVPVNGVDAIDKPAYSSWNPRLRAARSEYLWPSLFTRGNITAISYREIHFHGLIERGFLSVTRDSDGARGGHSHQLHREVPVVEFASLAVWADQLRTEAGAPTAEYAIDVEIVAKVRPCDVLRDTTDQQPLLGRLSKGSTSFPRYALRDAEQLPQLLEVFERDFVNACGTDLGNQQGNLTIEKRDNP